ncbi:MAG: hypothetical protein HFJ79_07770 [Clostridiales bacterium]|nr:hypothetical protein [Clostridiales bacterium]
MKKVLCTVMAGAMLVSMTAALSGCKRNNGPDGGDKAVEFVKQATGSDYATDIMLPELKDSELHIMMSLSYENIKKLDTEKNPQAQVQSTNIWKEVYGTDIVVDVVAESQQTEYLSTAVASGTSPDIIPANSMTFPLWSAKGLVADIDDEKFAAYFDLEDPVYNKELMDQFNFQGHPQWAVTSKPDFTYVIYNKTKFYLAGEKTPMDYYQQGSWTWSQFVKTAKAMTSGEDYGFNGWALFPYNSVYPMINLNDDGTVALNIDDTKYMSWMTEVYNFYQRDKAGRLDYNLQSWETTFPQGTDAMVITNLGHYERMVKVAKELEGDEFGIAPLPIFDKGGETERIVPASLWGYSISSGAQHPEAAATYIRLETMVSQNIKKAHPGYGYLDNVLTDEEKQMLEDTSTDKWFIEKILGIGDCYNIIDTKLVPPIYYNVNETSVQSEIDQVKPLLQAEVDDYNNDLRDRLAEAE